MSGRLVEALAALRKELKGSAKMYKVLSTAWGKHPTTVRRWLKRGRFPEPFDAYETALACGFTEQEAHEEMLVCFPEMAGKTA